MSDTQYPDVEVQLIGEDGNAFNIISQVSRAIHREHGEAAAQEFNTAALASDSYDALLKLVLRTVVVK